MTRAGRPQGQDADRSPSDGAHLDALRGHVAEILGPAGALITFSWTWYRRDHPTHLALKNCHLLLEATGDEVWWGDLDLTRRAEALSAAARAAGAALLAVFEHAPASGGAEPRLRWGDPDVVARVGPDGHIEVDPRRGYRRGDRLYRQTPAGYTRWERKWRRADPALLRPRERTRLLRRLAGVAPGELGAACRDVRLVLALSIEDDTWVASIPALECSGHGVDIQRALASLAGVVAAASGR